MPARPIPPRRPDLSRLCRALGAEARAHLDTSRGYPAHHAITPAILTDLRRSLRSPNPAERAEAVDGLRRRIIGRDPAPPRWALAAPALPPN